MDTGTTLAYIILWIWIIGLLGCVVWAFTEIFSKGHGVYLLVAITLVGSLMWALLRIKKHD